jgi:hypothetical protein
LLEASAFVPICAFGVIAVADLTVSVFKTSTSVPVINCEAVRVGVDIPLLPLPTDNAPVIFAPPTTSRETVGDELPIPIRASPPPTKYRLLEAFVFVPNCAMGVVRVAVSAKITPVEFIEDAKIPLFAVSCPDATSVVVSIPPVVFMKPLISTVVPFIADVASIVVAEIPAGALIIPNEVIVEADNPEFAVINPKAVIVEPDIIPPFVFTTPVVFMVFACIPVVVIPPDATICFPSGTAMPPLAVINPSACIVVEDTIVFAEIPPDAPIVVAVIVSDTLAFPTTSSETVGDELPMPILATLPPVK